MRGKSQNQVLEQQAVWHQYVRSVCTHSTLVSVPPLASAACVHGDPCMDAVPKAAASSKAFWDQRGPGHHRTLANRSVTGLGVLCTCAHLGAVVLVFAEGYQPMLIPWSWIPVSSGCWSSALFGSSSWHLRYTLSPPGKKRVEGFVSSDLKQVKWWQQHRKAWPWQGKCPARAGIDQAKLFYQHCICLKK